MYSRHAALLCTLASVSSSVFAASRGMPAGATNRAWRRPGCRNPVPSASARWARPAMRFADGMPSRRNFFASTCPRTSPRFSAVAWMCPPITAVTVSAPLLNDTMLKRAPESFSRRCIMACAPPPGEVVPTLMVFGFSRAAATRSFSVRYGEFSATARPLRSKPIAPSGWKLVHADVEPGAYRHADRGWSQPA